MQCTGLCYDYGATMARVKNQVGLASSIYQYKLTSACSPVYVKPTNVGVKHGDYMRVIYRRRALCTTPFST
jgi:hypothetical protein